MKDQIWKPGFVPRCCALIYSLLVYASSCQLPLPAPITWLRWAAASGNRVFAPSAAVVSCCESLACTAAAVTTVPLSCLTTLQCKPKWVQSIDEWSLSGRCWGTTEPIRFAIYSSIWQKCTDRQFALDLCPKPHSLPPILFKKKDAEEGRKTDDSPTTQRSGRKDLCRWPKVIRMR